MSGTDTTLGPPRGSSNELDGLSVLTLESRRDQELAGMLTRRGADVVRAPSMREVTLESNLAAIELFERLERAELDAIILLTGVGTRALAEAAGPRWGPERIRSLLGSVPLIARGPKPVAALRALGLEARLRVPEPNTWRELLTTLDRGLPVTGLRIAVQEYGATNPELMAGLEARGARVLRVPVYRWALPEDLGPLQQGIERLVAGRIDVVVLTTSIQLQHLLAVAAGRGAAGRTIDPDAVAVTGQDTGDAGLADREPQVVEALRRQVVVASIGPLCSEALAALGIPVHIEPSTPKLGPLVAAIAARAPGLVAARHDR